ncbi:tereporin-Ca1-like [Hydractinia symbiolongicarpus]|uniref:tereporin-Ca1-like n=1 Tax=Hydractinia symbiolongicarpus TaxID=13093 RepID=UPI00254DD227|nr:tereporin-Ca1-like [Hydractinia symbiolongicarpus]
MKFYAVLVLCLVGSTACRENDPKERKKRIIDAALAPIIGGAIVAGASLTGTTVAGLKSPSYTVSVSGSIENYSKWSIHLRQCQMASGYMNVPMRTIIPGYREGWASHKTGNTATGTYVRCTFQANNDLIHIMYSAPYSFDFHSNWLGVAICPKNNGECKSMTADKMYYRKSSFVSLKEYYRSISHLRQCRGDFCFTGIMGTSHKPEIDIRIYPRSYDNLSSAVQDSSAKDRWSKGDYDGFINGIKD